MNKDLLRTHIQNYLKRLATEPDEARRSAQERWERADFYQGWTAERIKGMTPDDISPYLSRLWAMQIWGNKQYVVNNILETNGIDKFRQELAVLVWGHDPLAKRWDRFREDIKSVGPAMMSEILCHTYPQQCMLWNRRTYVALNYLGVAELPKYDYQLTGERYQKLCEVCKEIAVEMAKAGAKDTTLLGVNYFVWNELQVGGALAGAVKSVADSKPPLAMEKDKKNFVHNEIRDKIADIGLWLGLQSQIEMKVANGAKVDTVWEVTIGNMGRVIYVFEVQTSGSIDSLLMNLLKALNNPAVQGVVAVSDAAQLEVIKKEAAGIHALAGKLKYWNYEEVMKVHDALSEVNSAINALGLVPQGF